MLASPALRALGGWLRAQEAAGVTVYPPRGTRLAALALTPLDHVRVVILGQDPYPGAGQAHGLAFSVQPGVPVPRSLGNIYTELHSDLGIPPARHGHLAAWAQQGVLLLNTALTVAAGQTGSHQHRGWEVLTDAVLAAVAARATPAVFLLWGGHAQKTAARIPALIGGPHCVLTAPHPSPLSAYRGFFGCRHFSRANDFLATQGRGTIDWRLPDQA